MSPEKCAELKEWATKNRERIRQYIEDRKRSMKKPMTNRHNVNDISKKKLT